MLIHRLRILLFVTYVFSTCLSLGAEIPPYASPSDTEESHMLVNSEFQTNLFFTKKSQPPFSESPFLNLFNLELDLEEEEELIKKHPINFITIKKESDLYHSIDLTFSNQKLSFFPVNYSKIYILLEVFRL